MDVMLTGSLSVSHLSNCAVSRYITFPKMHGNVRKKERIQQIKVAPRKDKIIMFLLILLRKVNQGSDQYSQFCKFSPPE